MMFFACKQANHYAPTKSGEGNRSVVRDRKKRTLTCKLIVFKQELKAVSENIYQKRITRRKAINKKINRKQTEVYREIKKRGSEHHRNSVTRSYCRCIIPNTYSIDGVILVTMIQKL